eukprot:1431487-Rhodomonas_salina.2
MGCLGRTSNLVCSGMPYPVLRQRACAGLQVPFDTLVRELDQVIYDAQTKSAFNRTGSQVGPSSELHYDYAGGGG